MGVWKIRVYEAGACGVDHDVEKIGMAEGGGVGEKGERLMLGMFWILRKWSNGVCGYRVGLRVTQTDCSASPVLMPCLFICLRSSIQATTVIVDTDIPRLVSSRRCQCLEMDSHHRFLGVVWLRVAGDGGQVGK